MVHCVFRLFTISLSIVGFALLSPASAEDSEPTSLASALKESFAKSTAESVTKELAGTLGGDLYKLLIRNGLVPKISRALLKTNQNFGTSPHHKLARKWHEVLMTQLRASNIPSKWKALAAKVHKDFGGQGDLLAALPAPGQKGRRFNVSSGLLREEFISHAMFFLNLFVPKGIKDCGGMAKVDGLQCVAKYHKQLETALIATLSSFFHYVIARTPSSRIVTTSFVFTVVYRCPFGYLVEPAFVLSVLKGASTRSLMFFASIRRVGLEKACPEEKEALLGVLMANGVTPADFSAVADLQYELGNIPDNVGELVKDAVDVIKEATAINPEMIFTDEATDHLKTLMKDQSLGSSELPNFGLEDLQRELQREIAVEDEENPMRVAIKPASGGSLEEQAKEVLSQMRNFGRQKSGFLNKKPKEKDD